MKQIFRIILPLLAGLFLGLFPTSVLGQNREPAQRESTQDDAVDAELDALLEEIAQEEDDDEPGSSAPATALADYLALSLVADFALSWFSDEPDLLGGHDPGDMGFNLQGLELNLSGAVDPYFRFDSSILLTLFGLEIEEAFATSLALPAGLQVRAGQFLTDFGRANPTHLHTWNFALQPLAVGKFMGGEGMRGLGVEISQLLPLPWAAQWSASAQNIGGLATGRSFLASTSEIESLLDLTVAGRLEQFFELTSSVELLFGLSAANGPNSTGRANRSDLFGADLLVKWRPASAGAYREIGWQNELWLRRRQTPGAADEPEGALLQDWATSSEVYFSPNLFWRFAARHEFLTGVEEDPLDPTWDQDRHRGAVNISFMPSHFSRIRLEYALDSMPYRSELNPLVHMAFLQLELVAGAHGAHTY